MGRVTGGAVTLNRNHHIGPYTRIFGVSTGPKKWTFGRFWGGVLYLCHLPASYGPAIIVQRAIPTAPQMSCGADISTGGGGTQLFLVGVCHAGFKMEGLGSGFSLKNWGLGNENLEKFKSRELEFWPKHGWKCKNFLKIENGAQERHIDGKWWAREQRLAWKKGSWPRPPYPFLMWVPPPRVYIYYFLPQVIAASPHFKLK